MARKKTPKRFADWSVETVRIVGPIAVGDWTFPYKKPRGTKAVQVVKITKQPRTGEPIAHLSDGTSMHASYAHRVPEGSVAP